MAAGASGSRARVSADRKPSGDGEAQPVTCVCGQGAEVMWSLAAHVFDKKRVR